MGFDEVEATFVKGHRQIIHEKEINNWHYVKNGQCSLEEAKLYFNSFFELDGKELALMYNLI